jgi:hypothetical protein
MSERASEQAKETDLAQHALVKLFFEDLLAHAVECLHPKIRIYNGIARIVPLCNTCQYQ